MTPSSPLIPISPSSSTALNDIDPCEARGTADLDEQLDYEGIVPFPVYIHHIQMNCWLKKSKAEFLGKEAEGIHCTLWAEDP